MGYKRENKEDELKKEHLTLYAPLTSYNETERHKPQISHRQNRWHWVLLLAFFSHSSIFYYIFSVTARRRRRKEKTTQAALQLFTYEFYVFFGRLVLFLSMRCDRFQFLFQFLFYFANCMPLSRFFSLLYPLRCRSWCWCCCCRCFCYRPYLGWYRFIVVADFFLLSQHLHFVLPHKNKINDREKKCLFNQKKQKWSKKNSTN